MTTTTPRDGDGLLAAREAGGMSGRSSRSIDAVESNARANDDVISEWLASLPDDAEGLVRMRHPRDEFEGTDGERGRP